LDSETEVGSALDIFCIRKAEFESEFESDSSLLPSLLLFVSWYRGLRGFMVESGGEMALWRHSMAPCCHGAVALHALQQGGFEGGQ
jgi:hypothetical protein